MSSSTSARGLVTSPVTFSCVLIAGHVGATRGDNTAPPTGRTHPILPLIPVFEFVTLETIHKRQQRIAKRGESLRVMTA